jgi:hypothetical protein
VSDNCDWLEPIHQSKSLVFIMSIWDVVETYQGGTFEQLIRDGASFEDILEQEKFIQEVKSETTILVD